MSLILGINLPKYLYLVCDTRLTIRSGEKVEYKDNFCKFYSYNENVSAVVAGNANFAGFILREIGKLDVIKEGFVNFENKIEEAIKLIVGEYIMAGNELSYNNKPISVFLIFAGFDKSAKKQVNSSQYGKTLSQIFVKGKTQFINMDIMKKIAEAAIKNGDGEVAKDTMIELDNPYSSILTVEVNLSEKPIIKTVDCYKYIMKAPKRLTEDVLPRELGYKLEKEQSKENGEDIMASQTVLLTAWIKELITKYELDTVGGDILSNMITSKGAIIMSGSVNYLNKETGEVGVLSEIIVHNEEFCVRNKKTQEILPLQNIYNYNDKGEGELML